MNNDIQRLKDQIDLHELAGRLGLEQPQERGNYRSPHHDDRNPSLSIFAAGKRWKDHSQDEGGDAIDLVRYVRSCEPGEAIAWLKREYGIETAAPRTNGQHRQRTLPEIIAHYSTQGDRQAALDYLVEERKIPEATAQWALRAGAVGLNTWTSEERPAGQVGHGGPAVAFICRRPADGQVVGVDLRYLDPDLNGGLKTSSQGDKGTPWIPSAAQLAKARTVYVVESAINALSVLGCGFKSTTAIATRGTSTWRGIDWGLLAGKRVILAMDADLPGDKGERAGPEAAWAIHEQLTAANIPCQMLDQERWYENEWNDLNDILQAQGVDGLKAVLRDVEPWLVPGVSGKGSPGRKRLFLPPHDFSIYWRYRVTEDFTRYIEKIEQEQEGDGEAGGKKWRDVCAFRIAAISQVQIADHNSVLSGETSAQPETVYAVSVQRPAADTELERRVVASERLHAVEQWKKFGAILHQQHFARMLAILERTTGLGRIDAVNFVGLCWRDGRLVVNEGPDTYFDDPDQQCPYHSLRFGTGTRNQAREVIQAYQATMGDDAALRLLCWALGGHMKALLGFWPHMALQGPKGSGKSVLTGRLQRTISMHMFGSQQIKTQFRLLCSVSCTSHPVGWEEISVNDQRTVDAAVEMLQQAYQSAHTTRGSEHTAFLIAAPVLMAGEDVPVKSLTGKLVREDLTGRTKGEMMPESLPRFPLRDWLEFLVSVGRDQARDNHQRWEKALRAQSRAGEDDSGAQRMVTNYAAVMTAAGLLFEWTELQTLTRPFFDHLVREMNIHIAATAHDREPWVWILESVLGDIDSEQFDYPWDISNVNGEECLILRHKHVMQHMQTTTRLRPIWDSLPVKTAAVFKRQLERAGVVANPDVERVISGRRHQHMLALSLAQLDRWGLDVSTREVAADLATPSWTEPAQAHEV